MISPTNSMTLCPYWDQNPSTGTILFTDVIYEAAMRATPYSSPPITTSLYLRDWAAWTASLQKAYGPYYLSVPSIIMRRAHCTDEEAICSYHGQSVVGFAWQTKRVTITTSIFIPALLLSNVPSTPEGTLVSDMTATSDNGALITEQKIYSTGYAVTVGTLTHYYDGIIAPDGMQIAQPSATTIDEEGNENTIQITDTYSVEASSILLTTCLRYEYDQVDSNVTIDTHQQIYTEDSPNLGWEFPKGD